MVRVAETRTKRKGRISPLEKAKIGWTPRVQPTNLFRCILAHNRKHKSCAKFESIRKDLALVDVG